MDGVGGEPSVYGAHLYLFILFRLAQWKCTHARTQTHIFAEEKRNERIRSTEKKDGECNSIAFTHGKATKGNSE